MMHCNYTRVFLSSLMYQTYCQFLPVFTVVFTGFFHCPGKNTFCCGKNPTLGPTAQRGPISDNVGPTAVDPNSPNIRTANLGPMFGTWLQSIQVVECLDAEWRGPSMMTCPSLSHNFLLPINIFLCKTIQQTNSLVKRFTLLTAKS